MLDNNELEKLFNSLRMGNIDAFEKIYNEMKVPVYTVILRIVNNKELAEEVLQEVFIKLYKNPPESDIKNIRAWVFAVAHNLSIDVLRRELKKNDIEKQYCNELYYDESKYDISEALNSLKDIEKIIIIYHINADLKFIEISEILNIPLGTVLWRYYNAIDKLKKYFQEKNDD